MSILKITTHKNDALARLLYQFKDLPRINSLVNMQSDQIQNLEDAAFDFLVKIPLATCSGIVLDRWGDLLSEARLGDNDADYRARLFFAIARNLSNGTPEELISFFNFLMQTEQCQIYEFFPGVVNFAAVNATNPADPILVKSQLQQLACAGVRIGWLMIGTNPHPFAFALHPNPEARGFDTYPVQEIGGEFVTVYL